MPHKHPIEIKERARSWYVQGLGLTDIAVRLGVGLSTVKTRTQDLPRQRSRLDPEHAASLRRDARRLANDGLTIADVARQLGLSYGTVQDWLRRRPEPPGPEPRGDRARTLRHPLPSAGAGTLWSVAMRRVVVAVGDEIAGARVIEIMARGQTTSTPTRRMAYRVACLRCGHERIVRHVSLLERITRGSEDCNSCKTWVPDAQKRQSPGGSDRGLGFNNSNAMEQNNARP